MFHILFFHPASAAPCLRWTHRYRVTIRAPSAALKVTLSQQRSATAPHAIGLTVIRLGAASSAAVTAATAAAGNMGNSGSAGSVMAAMRLLTMQEDDEVLVLGPFQCAHTIAAETNVVATQGMHGRAGEIL